MKASDVQILAAPDSDEAYTDENFIVVETAITAQGAKSSVKHMTRQPGEGARPVTQRPIARSLPYSHRAVIEWAVAFAALNDVPVVYERCHQQLRGPMAVPLAVA